MRFLFLGALVVLVACGGDDDGGTGPTATPASVSVSASATGTINQLSTTRVLTAEVRDANQAVINNANVTWSATPAGVVNLSTTTGLTTTLTAVGNGTTTVTARSGTVSATHAVTVTQDFASVSITPDPGTVIVGGTLQLTATALDPGGSALPAGGTVTFTSSDVTKATVNATGLVSGVAAGDVQITADVTRGGVTHSAVADVTVTVQNFPAAADVVAGNATQTFTPATVDIAVGGTVTWTFGALTHNVTFGGQTGAPANIATTTNTQIQRTFNTAGAFPYDCTVHPGMSGTVNVH